MTYPMFNLHDPQFVRHLEQSKMATKEEVGRLRDAIYSKVIRDIEHWCRDKSGQSCGNSDSISSVPTPPVSATQSKVIGKSPGQSTVEAQPNQVTNQTKRIITLSLQCPHCFIELPKYKLNQHIRRKHSIGPFRCIVKDCDQQFDDQYTLRGHIKQTHKHTTQWHCYKCDKQYNSYQFLCVHNIQNHQLGTFQCSFPSCTFTGNYRMKMSNHYTYKHKPPLTCQHFGCHFESTARANLRAHQQTHLGAKPYRCKWSQCDYASTRQAYTISHILQNHLTPYSSSVPKSAQLDPKDYVEVVHDLL